MSEEVCEPFMSDSLKGWATPTTDTTLHYDEVHVWLAEHEMFRSHIPDLHSLLNAEEVEKAAQFYFEKDRRRFIVTHGLLRRLLAGYANLPPAQISFYHNTYGKPELLADSQKDLLHFNLSHTRDLIAYAFTYKRNVGIDIEYMSTNIEYEQLSRRYFSPFENAELQRLPLSLRQQAFFHCWTRKEAYIKARGLGLSLALDSFDVTVQPDLPVKLLGSRENAQETNRWLFASLPMNSQYAGTLIAEGHDWHMHCWQLLPHNI